MGQSALSRSSKLMTFKSLFLVILMITMSLSAAIVQTPPSSPISDDETSDFSVMISYDSFEWDFAIMNPINWFGEEETPSRTCVASSCTNVDVWTVCTIHLVLAKHVLLDARNGNEHGYTVRHWNRNVLDNISFPTKWSFVVITTGAISGTPTALSSQTAYTVNASNSNGYDTATVTITVNEPLPVINYSPNTFTLSVGTAMTSVSPTIYAGTVDSYSVSPSLPSGLNLNTANGTISGTPTAVASSSTYTVTATNTAGTDTASLTIVVNDVAPTSITYSPSSFTLTKGTAMTTTTPSTTGGTVTTWSVSPSLPLGLSIASSDGAISGTPTAVTSQATYTITGTNTGGSITTTITIQVNDVAPIISYSTIPDLTKGTAMTTVSPTSSGGAVTSWAVSPSLPAGLTLSSTTGAISGTPTTVTPSAVYTITATNTGGTRN